MRQKTIKVCFISFNSWPLFEKNSKGYFGGAEVQISLITKSLAKDKNFKVSLVVGDYNQLTKIKKNKIVFHRCSAKSNHYFLIILNLIKTLVSIKADVYVERTMNVKVGLIALFCKVFNKKFVYMMAHDWDSTEDTRDYLKGFYRWLFQWGLKQADLVIAQNKKQQKQIKENFRKKSFLMRSMMISKSQKTNPKKQFGLWVGRADKWKQPLVFIRLAKHLPKEKFIMVCRLGSDKNYYKKMELEATKLKNLKFLPMIPFDNIDQYYQEAKVVVNTSTTEGFPNTFLQAGLAKTPILSLRVNPDHYLTKHNSGLIANGKFAKLITSYSKLKNKKLRQKLGINHYNYVDKYHSIDNIKQFKQAINQLCND